MPRPYGFPQPPPTQRLGNTRPVRAFLAWAPLSYYTVRMKFAHFSHVCNKPGMTPAQRYQQLWDELVL